MSVGLEIILIILLFVLLVLSAFFSASETAYSSIKPAKIESAIHKGKKSAKLIKKHYKSFGWTLSTILIANNFVNTAIASVMTFLFTQLMGASTLVTIISTFVATPILVIFGELVPKLLAKRFAYGYLSKVVYIMEFFNYLFFPLTYPISKFTLQSKVTNTEGEIRTLLRLARKERVLEDNEATLALKALELDSMIVKSVMTPKNKIVSIDINTNKKTARQVYAESGHSRLLVKDGNKYVGILLLKDILLLEDKDSIKAVMSPITYVSKSMLVTKALEEMRIYKTHLAVVVEKMGSESVVGIITIEDILEELVGEIYDEHDTTINVNIREIAHHKYIAYGMTMMRDLEKELEMKFDEVEDDMTLKQWVNIRINRRLKKGLRYEYKDAIVFKVRRNNHAQDMMFEITKKLG